MRRARGALLLLIAIAPGCILFGIGDDLQGGGAASDSGADTEIVDTSTTDGAATDSTTSVGDSGTDGAAAFDCKSIDATFCDSFDRDATIAVGAPWTSSNTRPGCTITVDGQLTTTFDASTGQQNCYLISNQVLTKSGHFTLDFDLSYVTDPSNITLALIAQLVVSYPGGSADSGVEFKTSNCS